MTVKHKLNEASSKFGSCQLMDDFTVSSRQILIWINNQNQILLNWISSIEFCVNRQTLFFENAQRKAQQSSAIWFQNLQIKVILKNLLIFMILMIFN